MPVIVDNSFKLDNCGIKLERLVNIEVNLTLIQTELIAPVDIFTWAETCFSDYSDLMTYKDVE